MGKRKERILLRVSSGTVELEGYGDTQHSDRDGSGVRDRTTVWIAECNRQYVRGDNYSKDGWRRKRGKGGRLLLTGRRGPVPIHCP